MMATEKIRLFGLFVHAIVFVGVLAGCMSGDFLHIEEPEKTTLTFRHFYDWQDTIGLWSGLSRM